MAADTRGCVKQLRRVPTFQQRTGEKESRFINRIDRESAAVINRTQMETKFKVSYEEQENGQLKLKKKRKSKKKIEKDRKKIEARKERDVNRKDKNKDGFERLADTVTFGDIVHRPPVLTSAPRKAPQTGGKNSYKLCNMLLGKDGVKPCLAKRDMLEKERERVVKLYRKQKEMKQMPFKMFE